MEIIQPILPTKSRGVLNGIFWVLRSGAPWRDLPDQYGPTQLAFSLNIKVARGLVEEQDTRRSVQSSRQQQTMFLAAGKRRPHIADQRAKAHGHCHDVFVYGSHFLRRRDSLHAA